MDVSTCNSLLDLRFLALVLSRTLNGSSDHKKNNLDFEIVKRPVDSLPAFSLVRPAGRTHLKV